MTDTRLTFGSDPEFFLHDIRTGGPVPAVGLVGGTKEAPRMVGPYGVQEDNVMAEFTTPVERTLSANITRAHRGVHELLSNLRAGPGRYTMHHDCCVLFPLAVLSAAGPQAAQFGCSPDFDAYKLGARHPRISPNELIEGAGAWRFSGGHIHVGYKHVNEGMPEYVATMMCDLTLGLTLIRAGEQQGPRRRLYGMAGRFRPTAYGVEYRTPSNQWLYRGRLSEYLSTAGEVLNNLFQQEEHVLVSLYNEVPWADVAGAINSEDSDTALSLIQWASRAYPEIGFDNLG